MYSMKHPMDSQVTLVDSYGLTSSWENIVLIFDRDNMLSTALHVPGNSQPSYIVKTRQTTTTIYAEGYLLATITRRLFRRDQIRFPGLKPIPLGRWLKTPILSTFPLAFHACGRRFEWRDNVSGQLVLCDPSCPNEVLAWFSKSRQWDEDHMTRPASLTIKPELVEMRDLIVLSCLLAEYKLRVISVEQARTASMFMMMIF